MSSFNEIRRHLQVGESDLTDGEFALSVADDLAEAGEETQVQMARLLDCLMVRGVITVEDADAIQPPGPCIRGGSQ